MSAPLEVRAGDIVQARFAPARTDDLSEAAERIIGQTHRWTAVRIIDELDDVGYVGQWRMQLGRNDFDATGVRWTPLCDLGEIELVGRDREIAVLNGPWDEEADEQGSTTARTSGASTIASPTATEVSG